MTHSQAHPKERGECPHCRRDVALLIPKGGDGSQLVAYPHALRDTYKRGKGSLRCPGSGRRVASQKPG
jgi:hypothetical protein